MYQSLLQDSRHFEFLLSVDTDLAAEARRSGCECGGVLHSAHYERKPRGGPAALGPESAKRFSFCCATEGCRRRATPPSLRFFGRKVFLGVLVVLVPVLRDGPTPERLARLCERFTVSARTSEALDALLARDVRDEPYMAGGAWSFRGPCPGGGHALVARERVLRDQ